MLLGRSTIPIVISSTIPSEPRSQFATPEKSYAGSSSGFWNSPAAVVPPGVIVGHASIIVDSDETWKENLHIVLDDYALLLVSCEPEKSGVGIVRLVAPIHQTDVSISTEKRNILKVLVRSTETVPLMEKIGATSENVLGSPDMISRKSFAQVSNAAAKWINLLHPRQQNVLWRLSIWFENDSDCEAVSQHIELRRIQVRHEKLKSLKALLDGWSDSGSFNPDENNI